MDKEHLSDAIGNVRDRYISSADKSNKNRKRLIKYFIGAAAAAALALTAVFALPKLLPSNLSPDISGAPEPSQTAERSSTDTDTEENTEPATSNNSPEAGYLSYAEIEAEYPEYSEGFLWRTKAESEYGFSFEDARGFSVKFYTDIISELLGDKSSENAVLSPMSIFFSLASLAEITEGETRAQILSLLGADSIEQLRTLSMATWLGIYSNGVFLDDPYENEQLCIPANSFWLNSNAEVSGDPDTAEILKKNYYTSFYKGDPMDDRYIAGYREWLEKHTGGLLKGFSDNAKIDPGDIFTVVNTILLEVSWIEPFNEEDNFIGEFYGADATLNTEYMFKEYTTDGKYYENEDLKAVSIMTKSNAAMWFILPENGNTVSSIINNGSYADLIKELKDKNTTAFDPPEGYDMYCIQYTIPKFDVTSEYELPEKLKALGVKDAFDPDKADIPFITMKDGSNIFITGASQNARVSINEQGISAAAATVLTGGMGSPVFKYVDFVLNRPFMFLITYYGAPLFAGVINVPGE